MEALGGASSWVLIGGPPCQAYSIVGRVRMRGENPSRYESDHRHFLYRQYLRILEEHHPPVFVMENVKGMLSASVGGSPIFDRILKDLTELNYTLYSFVKPSSHDLFGIAPEPTDFIIQSERYGVPQARHRVILLGVKVGFKGVPSIISPWPEAATLWQAIKDLPRVRSCMSRTDNSGPTWLSAIRGILEKKIINDPVIERDLRKLIRQKARALKDGLSTGAEFIPHSKKPSYLPRWFRDPLLGGICNHTTRAHIGEDLQRYFFAICFGILRNVPPVLAHFPKALLPQHDNVRAGVDGEMFRDRFRVQLKCRTSTTITSHICKDGHYFIHPDPKQCRSLTVREAARVQTFPDNYFFVGPRTAQYQQVGNAVPPLLARQLAEVVFGLFAIRRKPRENRNGSTQPPAAKLEHVPDQVPQHRT